MIHPDLKKNDDEDDDADKPLGICRCCDGVFLKTESQWEFCSWDCEWDWLSGN